MTPRARRALGSAVAATLAATALALGAALGAGPGPPGAAHAEHAARASAAKPSPLAALDRRFRHLVPAARCTEAAATVARARQRRARALRGARTATPKALRAKRAGMRSAIALMRRAGAACAAAAPPAGGPAPPAPGPGDPGTSTGGAPPAPPPAQVITLHVAAGTTFQYTETSATATAGAFRIELQNASGLRHFAGVRAGEGQPTIAESPLSTPNGGVVVVDVTLGPGTYQVFCRNNGHDQLGMKIPLTVTS